MQLSLLNFALCALSVTALLEWVSEYAVRAYFMTYFCRISDCSVQSTNVKNIFNVFYKSF